MTMCDPCRRKRMQRISAIRPLYGSLFSIITDPLETSAACIRSAARRAKAFFVEQLHPMRYLFCCILIHVIILSANAQLWLDPTFGTGGVVSTSTSPTFAGALAMALQPDGRIVVVGSTGTTGNAADLLLIRYLPDGSLDPSFGVGGITTLDVGTTDIAYDVALQSDGAIVVVGTVFGVGTDKVVARFTADGAVDTSFNGTGTLVIDDSFAEDQFNGVTVQPDGRIVVVGQGFNGSKDAFHIMRLLPDGSFDPSFGTNGQVEHLIGIDNCRAYDVAVMPDGRIVSVGTSFTTGQNGFDVAVVRYLPDGSFDTAFSADGKVTFSWSITADIGYAVCLQPDGGILVGGAEGEESITVGIAVSRLLESGELDMSFGTGGTFRSFMGVSPTRCGGLALDGDNNILVAGTAGASSADRKSYLCRLLPSGQPDGSFGTAGELYHSVPDVGDDTPGIAVQPDGRILLAGAVGNIFASDVRVLRYLPEAITSVPEDEDRSVRLLHADARGLHMFCSVSSTLNYALLDARGTVITIGSAQVNAQGPWYIAFPGAITAGAYVLTYGTEDARGVLRFAVVD